MTYIKSIKMQGFKSFAKPTELLFDKDLSLILGPNGVGKSNITEAICFVLGRLSAKSMRAKRAANLIYNGGKKQKSANEAKVEMVLDNSKNIFPLEGDINVSRTVRHDGNSIYKINNKTKTRQEIQELLGHANIDPKGFNIILQEEITQFIEMHSEERRKIIEEIAGISIYEIRKEKSQRELEKTEERLKEISTTLRERTAYLKNLDKERVQALRYDRLKKSLVQDKASLLHKQMHEKKQEQEKINKQIAEKGKGLGKSKKGADSIQEKVNHLNNKIDEINTSIEKATGIGQESLHKDITEGRAEVAGLSMKLENYSENIRKMDDRNKQLQDDIKKTAFEIEQLEKEKQKAKPEKKIDIESFKEQLFNLASEFKNNNKQLFGLMKELSKKINNYANEIKHVNDPILISKKLGDISSLLSANSKSSNAIASSLEESYKQLEKLIGMKIGKDDGRRNIESELMLKNQDIEKSEIIIKQNLKEKIELEESINSLRGELEEKEGAAEEKEAEEKKVYAGFQTLIKKRSDLQEKLKLLQEGLINDRGKERGIESEINVLKVVKAKIDGECEILEKDFEQYKDIEIKSGIRAEIEQRIRRKELELEEIGSVNMRALQVYEGIKKQYDEVAEKARKLDEEKLEILRIISEIDSRKRRTFMKVFNALNEKFTNNFSKLIFNKGPAFLELENKENPFEAGVNVSVRIAKGKYLDITSLSGGERTLAALSLIFAIQEYKPHYFYIFDEIDAALDKRNSEKLSNLITNFKGKGQCIIISHNDSMISECGNYVYGVTMQEGMSKVLSLKI